MNTVKKLLLSAIVIAGALQTSVAFGRYYYDDRYYGRPYATDVAAGTVDTAADVATGTVEAGADVVGDVLTGGRRAARRAYYGPVSERPYEHDVYHE